MVELMVVLAFEFLDYASAHFALLFPPDVFLRFVCFAVFELGTFGAFEVPLFFSLSDALSFY